MTLDNSQPHKNIVIIGGSLTGLMTAIPLLRLGHKVTILERTPSSSLIDQGAGIASIPSLAPILTALSALSKNPNTISPLVDFFNEFDRTKTPFSCGELINLRWLNNKGEVKNEVSARLAAGLKDGLPGSGGCSWDLLYTILRANFDGGLQGSYVLPAEKMESDGEARYLDGVEVTSLREHGDRVEVLYSGGSLMADFVVGADGPSSVVRRLLLPEEGRKYVGYVAWRGTVKETELSRETRELLNDHVGIYQGKGTQVILYRIPGLNGSIEEGDQLMNMVWYTNHEDIKEILTDSSGMQHRFSLGIGKIHPAVRQQQLERAATTIPPPLLEIWSKVKLPFIQAITDSLSSRAVFMNGKVVLAGDALAGFRPHTTAGTAQGAMHALLLKDVVAGEMDINEWEQKVLGFAKFASGLGIALGTQSQVGKHPMADED